MDILEKKDLRPDSFEKGNYPDDESIAGKYATKLRKSCAKVFTKRAL